MFARFNFRNKYGVGWLGMAIIFMPYFVDASGVYITGNRIRDALRQKYANNNLLLNAEFNCDSCHAGPPSLNNTFGAHYRAAGGLGGSQTVATILAGPLANTAFLAQDSDGDGESNEVEFMNQTDPVDRLSNSKTNTGSGGNNNGTINVGQGGIPEEEEAPPAAAVPTSGRTMSGCGGGMTQQSSASTGSFFFLMGVPMMAFTFLRRRRKK